MWLPLVKDRFRAIFREDINGEEEGKLQASFFPALYKKTEGGGGLKICQLTARHLHVLVLASSSLGNSCLEGKDQDEILNSPKEQGKIFWMTMSTSCQPACRSVCYTMMMISKEQRSKLRGLAEKRETIQIAISS